jgi:hypothetical protein
VPRPPGPPRHSAGHGTAYGAVPSSRFVRSSSSVTSRSRPAGRAGRCSRRPAVAGGTARGSGSTVSSPFLLQLPQLRHEDEPTVHGRDDSLVVDCDLLADGVEPVPHDAPTVTATISAPALKMPCRIMGG